MAWPGIDQWLGGAHEAELMPMSWDELGRLAEAGWEIGSHSRTHPQLTQLDDESVAHELDRVAGESKSASAGPARRWPTPTATTTAGRAGRRRGRLLGRRHLAGSTAPRAPARLAASGGLPLGRRAPLSAEGLARHAPSAELASVARMRTIVVGATGTLGGEVAGALEARHEVVRVSAAGDPRVDLADPASIAALAVLGGLRRDRLLRGERPGHAALRRGLPAQPRAKLLGTG